MSKFLNFIHAHMFPIILALIVVGTGAGLLWHDLFVALKPTIPWSLFVMLYPMMIGLSLGKFVEISKKPKEAILAVLLNQVVAALIIGPLVLLTMRQQPKLGAGMILMGIGPLAGSAAAFAGIAGGDVAMVVLDVVLTMLVSIVAVPLWTLLWVGQMIPVPTWAIFKSILLYVVLPLVVGQLTRWWLIRQYGEAWIKRNKHYFGPISLLGVFWMVLIVFGLEGGMILKNPLLAIEAVVVMLVFYLIMFAIPIALGKLMHLPYENVVALTYGASSKNMSISSALAIANFGPIAAIGVAMGGPFTEMWLLILLASLFPRWRHFFEKSFSSVPTAT